MGAQGDDLPLNHAGVTATAFAAAMERFDIAPGARVAVAVSGGADSMALAHLLAAWAQPRGVDIAGVTVDHRLRAEAAAEARQAGAWLSALGIAHTILAWENPVLRPGRSPQKAARDARYALMSGWCRDEKRTHLFVAHHADDQAETFLIRLTRGSGVNGLAAMAPAAALPHGVTLARPLLDFPKSALEDTCRDAGQGWIEDPSNANPAGARVRLRQAAQILAAEGLTRERLLDTVGHMQRARAALDQAVDMLLADACTWDDCAVAQLELAPLRAAPEEIALRALAHVLTAAGGQDYGPRFESLEALYRRACAGPWRDSTLHGCAMVRDGGALRIFREAAQIGGEQALDPSGETVWDGRFIVSVSGAVSEGGARNFRIGALRGRDSLPADSPPNSSGAHRALSQIPAAVRSTLPVLFDSAGLAAVPHLHFAREDLTGIAFKITCIPALKSPRGPSIPVKKAAATPGADM